MINSCFKEKILLDLTAVLLFPIIGIMNPTLITMIYVFVGLVRTMRDPQFLFNYKIITNNDIAAATINAGWKSKVGAVANEDNLKKCWTRLGCHRQ